MLGRLGFFLALLLLAGCALPSQLPQINVPIVAPTSVPDASTRATSAPPTSAPAPTISMPAPTMPAPTAAPSLILDDPARLAAATPATRDQIALAEALRGLRDVPDVARTTPLDVQVGAVETFWVADLVDNKRYQVDATLRYAGPHTLVYIDTRLDVEQEAINSSAHEFEERIYARDRSIFGQERSPGVDGDPRITVLVTPLRGAGGYFSSADGFVKAVNRFSNEREMFVISTRPGTQQFASTLAHEFQHMIESNEQRRSPSWFDEGMSVLAQDLNGYVTDGATLLALKNPDIRLTGWSSDAAQTSEHYGTSQLFMRYFYEHYAQDKGVTELITSDAGNRPEVFAQVAARKRADIGSFADLAADWAVANVLNDPAIDGGRYAYQLLPDTVEPEAAATQSGSGTVNQFGADYLRLPDGPVILAFDGEDAVSVTGAVPQSGRYAWWSNRGDDSVATLTRAFDLGALQQATLQFSVWHELELDWDYGFITVSTDGGATWTTLKGNTTTNNDPQGNNYGNGLTGVSGAPATVPDKGSEGQWIEEQVDLSPYAGKQVLLRFWAITDDAYNAAGLMIDNIRIPELGYSYDAERDEGGWEAHGFVRTTGLLPQRWTLRLARQTASGTTVEHISVDDQGRATVQLHSDEQGVLVLIGSTPVTGEVARYRYSVMR